jgi:hypothetical protein
MRDRLLCKAGLRGGGLLLLGCLLLQAVRAEDAVVIKTPQPAVVQFTNGQVQRGILLAVSDKEVRFQQARAGANAVPYKPAVIKAIQTADDVYVYNADKKQFESMKAAQASKLKEKPDEKSLLPIKEPAQEKKPREDRATVVVEGVAAEQDDALKDAFRSAIQQVVGTLVDAETLVEDDKVISDKVLTYSDGVIKAYKEVSRKQEKGLWRIKISAVVERRRVAARLREVGVTVKEVEGKDIAAEVLTRTEARAKATELLQKALADLPNVLVAEAKKPGAGDYDEDKKTLRVQVAVRADLAKYKKFLERTMTVLDKVQLAKDFLIVESEPDSGRPGRFSLREGEFQAQTRGENQKGWYLWLMTRIDAQAVRTRWDVYLVDSDVSKSISGFAGKLTALVSFLDEDGKVIVEDEVPLKPQYSSESWLWMGGEVGRDGTWNICVAPLCFDFPNTFALCYAAAVTYKREIKMTEAELKRLKDVKCAIHYRPGKAE